VVLRRSTRQFSPGTQFSSVGRWSCTSFHRQGHCRDRKVRSQIRSTSATSPNRGLSLPASAGRLAGTRRCSVRSGPECAQADCTEIQTAGGSGDDPIQGPSPLSPRSDPPPRRCARARCRRPASLPGSPGQRGSPRTALAAAGTGRSPDRPKVAAPAGNSPGDVARWARFRKRA
jgi:hypothetical protein